MKDEQLIEIKLTKEQIKIIQTALTYFDRDNQYGWKEEIIYTFNHLTDAIHRVDVQKAFERRVELDRQRELEREKNE